jgi:hypothetical protein
MKERHSMGGECRTIGRESEEPPLSPTSGGSIPDGKGFILIRENDTTGPRKIEVVVNWPEELKQRTPAAN